jgi:adenylate kinase family enzyme
MPSTPTSPANRNRAILLLGPTGAGKTPLGQMIQQRGLWGAKCRHFDFGANLRAMASRNRPDNFVSRQDIDLIRQLLETGALLEEEQFPLAENILRFFMTDHEVDKDIWIVLNGLPRHVGQAQAIDAILDVHSVVSLECSTQTVFERIQADVGGDRAQRDDDDWRAVRRKLAIFHKRTVPLLQHYARQGATSRTIEVTATLGAEQMWQRLEELAI